MWVLPKPTRCGAKEFVSDPELDRIDFVAWEATPRNHFRSLFVRPLCLSVFHNETDDDLFLFSNQNIWCLTYCFIRERIACTNLERWRSNTQKVKLIRQTNLYAMKQKELQIDKFVYGFQHIFYSKTEMKSVFFFK